MANNTSAIHIDADGLYSLIYPPPRGTTMVAAESRRRRYPTSLSPVVSWLVALIPRHTEEATKNPGEPFIIPRAGDVLKEIHIFGHFTKARLYQYDWTGGNKIIYDTLECTKDDDSKMIPFGTSGLPLICIGKTLYLDVDDAQANITVECVFGFLSDEDRMTLARFKSGNSDHGIKVMHNDGSIYQVIGMNNVGHSPNYLQKL